VKIKPVIAPPLGGGAPADGAVPALPVARGAATGAAAVGTDPGLLHFTVDGWLDRVVAATWSTGDGVEGLDLVRADQTEYSIGLAHDKDALDGLRRSALDLNRSGPDWDRGHPEPVQVGGRPGELIVMDGEFTLRWAPAEGLWAQVFGTLGHADPQAALDLGARIRLGTAFRCASPLHVGWLPPGAGVQGCAITLTGYDIADSLNQPTRVLQSRITVGDGSFRAAIQLLSGYKQATVPDLGPDLVAPSSGELAPTGHDLAPGLVAPSSGEFTVFYTTVAARAVGMTAVNNDGSQLEPIAKGLTLVGDGRDPGSWPERLAG
jgi:hypothetical protein